MNYERILYLLKLEVQRLDNLHEVEEGRGADIITLAHISAEISGVYRSINIIKQESNRLKSTIREDEPKNHSGVLQLEDQDLGIIHTYVLKFKYLLDILNFPDLENRQVTSDGAHVYIHGSRVCIIEGTSKAFFERKLFLSKVKDVLDNMDEDDSF